MLEVIILTILFSITTVISILLLGSRAIIGGDMTFLNIVKIIFSWQFILGAIFAFGSRLIFMVINSAVYRIPSLANSSTTVTTLITTVSIVFVIIANAIFLQEKINFVQGIGAVIILFGIFLVAR